MATMMILKQAGPITGLCMLERYLVNNYASSAFGLFDTYSGPVSRAYGVVIAVNCIASGFVLLSLGFKVGAARKKYGVKYPKMYASGDSDDDTTFNCIQRAHQQALETYPTFLVCSVLGGIRQPLTTAAYGLLWCVARLKWAEGKLKCVDFFCVVTT